MTTHRHPRTNRSRQCHRLNRSAGHEPTTLPQPVPPVEQSDLLVLVSDEEKAGRPLAPFGKFVGPDYIAPENIPAYAREPEPDMPEPATTG
jgi:hypothetical protein